MSVIKGQHLRLKFGTKFVAFAMDCTVHVSATLEDSSTKDTSDANGIAWQEQELTGMAWDISTTALYSVDPGGTAGDADGMDGEAALDLILAGQKVWVEFTGASGTNNRTASGNKYGGYVILSDESIQCTNRQNSQYTLQAQGTGSLSKNPQAPTASTI